MSKLRCTVVAPERPLFEGGADKVVAQGTRGQIAVLPRHAPLIAKLEAGVVRIEKDGGGTEKYAVSGGFLQVRANHVTLLVTDATRAEDVNRPALEAELAKVLEGLSHPKSDEEFATLLHRRKSLQAQLAIVS